MESRGPEHGWTWSIVVCTQFVAILVHALRAAKVLHDAELLLSFVPSLITVLTLNVVAYSFVIPSAQRLVRWLSSWIVAITRKIFVPLRTCWSCTTRCRWCWSCLLWLFFFPTRCTCSIFALCVTNAPERFLGLVKNVIVDVWLATTRLGILLFANYGIMTVMVITTRGQYTTNTLAFYSMHAIYLQWGLHILLTASEFNNSPANNSSANGSSKKSVNKSSKKKNRRRKRRKKKKNRRKQKKGKAERKQPTEIATDKTGKTLRYSLSEALVSIAISQLFLFLQFRIRSLQHIPYHEDVLDNETIYLMAQLLISTFFIARRPAASIGTVFGIMAFILITWVMIEDPVQFPDSTRYWLHLSRRILLLVECLLVATGLPLFPLPTKVWRVFVKLIGVCHVIVVLL